MVMYFRVDALSLTVVHGSRAGHSSDGDVLSSGRIVPYSGSRVASRTSFRWCCTFKWMRCPLQWFTGREPDILQMVMYFQVGALSLTVVHGSRAGHPSDCDVLSSGCVVPYSGSRVASRTY